MLRNKGDERCTLYKMKSSVIWSPLNHPNQWIFSSTQQTQVTVVCDGHTDLWELQGSSLLKLHDDCALKHHDVTIQAHKIFESTIYESYVFFGSFGIVNNSKPRLIVNGSPLDLHDELQQLKQLHQIINQTSIIELPSKIWKDNVHQYATSYSALTLIIVTIICIFWKMRHVNANSTETTTEPQHAPTDPERAMTDYCKLFLTCINLLNFILDFFELVNSRPAVCLVS